MASLVAFIFGLLVGSFLNVCIHRIPQGFSIVRPRSRCPQCKTPIRAYDNIPLVSYLLLGGRCRHCRARISIVYPIVELASGLTFWWVYGQFGLSLVAAKFILLGALLIVLIFTDLAERLLPDRITFFGLGVGIILSLLVAVGDGSAASLARRLLGSELPVALGSLVDALLGAATGAGFLFFVGETYYRLRRIEGMGLGDVKMMAMVGSFLGVKLTLLTILLGSLTGGILGGAYILLTRRSSRYELPFGSFLGLGAILAALWGVRLLGWYRDLVGG